MRTLTERRFITESAYLKLFVAWETYLESSFHCYLQGLPSRTGSAMAKHAAPPNAAHAAAMVLGISKFVDWANPENARKLAKVYFQNGEPYETVIKGALSDLNDMKIVRNAAAHLSSTTSQSLNALAIRILGQTVSGIMYDFIMASHPASGTQTMFSYYLQLVDLAAEKIADG